MKKTLALLLVLTMVLGLSLSGCGKKGSDTEEVKDFTVNVGAYPDTIDPALNSAVDGATYIIHAFSGLVGFKQAEDGTLELFADCAKELPKATELENGMVQYVFELKDDLKWSDGSELTAADFVYAWNRAASPVTAADYGYMFDVIDGYAELTESVEDADGNVTITNPDAKLNVTASEDGKSLTVVLPVDAPYFLELCAFPAYMPVKQSVVESNEAWATAVETYIGNGPYKVTEFTQSQLIMEKNENYYNADAVVSDKITFAFNDDDNSLITNYKSGAYLFIDSVPTEEIASLQEEYPEEFVIEGQLGTYYISFNVNDSALSAFTQEEKTKIRTAMSLIIDRNYIVEEIAQAGQLPANGFVAMGLTEPDGTEYISNNGLKGDGKGYFSVAKEDYEANCTQAIALLNEVAQSSGKFTVGADNKLSTDFPTLAYITNINTGHEAIAQNLQATFANYGINMTIETQEWASFLNTRKDGNYSVARNGWLGDYNDPISFLDMWTTDSGNNDSQFGRGDHESYTGYTYNGDSGKTWAESYDKLISDVKATKDQEKRFELMHQAENVLMSTAAICPLYYYTDIYMCSESIDGFFSSPLGFKYFMYASVK